MRIIPGQTKVQIELFRGVTLSDVLVAALLAVMAAFIVVSTLPFRLVFFVVHCMISALLLARFDKEPNYKYLLSIIRHFANRRSYERVYDDVDLQTAASVGNNEVAFNNIFGDEAEEKPEEPAEAAETKAERKARKKKEKAEYKADTKRLKSKKLTKEEEDAIWLKRAQQSREKKDSRKAASSAKKEADKDWSNMKDLSSFTDIADNFIVYGNKYYGAALEIPSVEFRFFSEFRRVNSIENALGSILRSLRSDYSMNMVKIERPISYDAYIDLEYSKLDVLKRSFENGLLNEDELKSRVAIVYDRINELLSLRDNNKVVVPFYYLVFFDSDKTQLTYAVEQAIESLHLGEMRPHRLNSKELAVFLKYTNALDFDENEIDNLRPQDYAAWAMPKTVEFTARTTQVEGIATHNFRVVAYPTSVYDAWLASLMTYPSTKVMVKMKPMDSGKAITAIDRSLSELRGKVSSARTDSEAMEAQTHLDTLQLLLSTLQGESESLLDVNIYITAYDVVHTQENPKIKDLEYDSYRVRTNNMKKATRRAWQEAGFRLNNMEFNQAIAYVGSQVSGYDPLERSGRGIPSNTIAAAFPWVFPRIMDGAGVKLGSSDGVPVFLDFFQRDSERVNSNMVIVGKSGSGKSYATKSLLSNLAADGAKIFVLDPENEYTELAKNLNGKFINVANAQYGRLNPFQIITALDDEDAGEAVASSSYATHLQFLEEFFKQILPDCEKDALEYLNALVDRVYRVKGISPYSDLAKLKPEDYPIFDDLYDEILREFQRTDNEYIKSMLRTLMNHISKFSEGGRNAIIWNGPSSVTTDENFIVFNFQSLLANRNTTVANAQMLLVLKYIDNEIIKNRDYNIKYGLHRKIVVVIDEAHVFIDTKYPVALDFMFQLAKRIRKYDGMQIVITQNIKDFVGSEEIARKSTAIINACQYSFIFALAPNDMGDLCKLYEKAGGINESEQEQIVQAGRGQAFTIMSPVSRSSFKVTVPEDVADLFSYGEYQNPYFTGEGGDKNWADYIGDSADRRWINLGLDEKAEDAADELPDGDFSISFEETPAIGNIKFNEISAEEAEPEIPAPAPQPEVPVFVETKVPEPVISIGPSRTEELLAELMLKLGNQTITDEIKLAIKEEIAKEFAARSADLYQPAPVREERKAPVSEPEDASEDLSLDLGEPDEDDDFSLGNIFDFAEDDFSAESDITDESPSAADSDEDDDDGLDIMSFLTQYAKTEENPAGEDSSASSAAAISEFEESGASVTDISLEDLTAYLKSEK